MRSVSLLALIVLQTASVTNGEGFKVLALIPYDGESHFYVFRPILEELARRGNNVTVVSHYPRKTPLKNYYDISMVDENPDAISVKNMNATGSSTPVQKMKFVLLIGIEKVCRKGMLHPNIQKLMKSEERYDLIITEIFNTDCFLGFVYKFQAPFIAVRTSPMSPWTGDRMANPDNPSYVPNSLLGIQSKMSFWERLENFLFIWYYKMLYHYQNDLVSTEIARQYFGEDMPPVDEIAKNVSLILVNTHFVHQIARPLVPGIKEIGGIHIGKNRSLPQDVEDWISGAEHGVVYFSMGSMMKSASISESMKMAFINAFAELPQRVLMKWDGREPSNLPSNVKTYDWLPQYDILCHPNVKAYIGHGGLLGATEAVYAGKPMIVIPAIGDQYTNAALLEEKGFAIILNSQTITREAILAALEKILLNPSFAETAKKMSEAIRDRLVSPLEEAVYWVEYVARHKGAPFLRSPAHGLPLYQYLLLDVFGASAVAVLLVLLISCIIVRKVIRRLQRNISENLEKKRN